MFSSHQRKGTLVEIRNAQIFVNHYCFSSKKVVLFAYEKKSKKLSLLAKIRDLSAIGLSTIPNVFKSQ